MEKKFWNYAYSLLLSIILLLLIGIFLNLNSSQHNVENNVVLSNEQDLTESVLEEKKERITEKHTIFLPDILDQKVRDLPWYNKYIRDRYQEKKKVKIAIIIDDMGYQKDIAEQIMNLDFPVAVSVLPFLPHSRVITEMAKERGFTVLLHLPMEPHNSNIDPGKGAIFTTMTEQEIRAKIRANLQDVPDIDGVNNHMGSKVTEDENVMRIVLDEIKKNDLFFIDSITSPNSVGYKLSKEMGVKTAQRNVFLDNEQDREYIISQVAVLKDIAQKFGSAIAIGHPYCNTISILTELRSILNPAEIEIVPIVELLH